MADASQNLKTHLHYHADSIIIKDASRVFRSTIRFLFVPRKCCKDGYSRSLSKRLLDHVRHEITLMSVMECCNRELEFVAQAYNPSKVHLNQHVGGKSQNGTRMTRISTYCFVKVNVNLISSQQHALTQTLKTQTLTRPRMTSTNASHLRSVGMASDSPVQRPALAFVQ